MIQHESVGFAQVSVGLAVIDPQPRLVGRQVPVQVGAGGGVVPVQQERVPHCVASDSAVSLPRQPPVGRHVPIFPLTFPVQTLPAVGTQQTRPTLQAGSTSEMPAQVAPLPQTPVLPVTAPVQKHPGPVQPDGGVATQVLPSQLEPGAHVPCAVAEPSDVPPSLTSKMFDPKVIVRDSPDEEAAREKTVPF